jgi:uncharacterized Zn-finger protein
LATLTKGRSPGAQEVERAHTFQRSGRGATARIGNLHDPRQNPIAMSTIATAPANAEKRYTVTRADLPLSCPLPSMALWNSHPRVYLPIEDAPNGEADCPYCGSRFVLAD